MTWTQEMRRRGAACASPEELLALAQAEGVPMTEGEARAYFTRLHPPAGELADDELEAVSGGGCGGGIQFPTGSFVRVKYRPYTTLHCCTCGTDRLKVTAVNGGSRTVACPEGHQNFFEVEGVYGAGRTYRPSVNVDVEELRSAGE